jgi:hypothetical protein
VKTVLRKHGLLLLQDKSLPSIATAIAGEPIRGSWWSHPKSQEIFDCLQSLEDVLTTRLVDGKVTYIDDRLRDAFLTVATSAEPWQTRGLTPAARALLAKVRRGGDVQATGAAARELQQRLLADAIEVHTESGKHETRLRAWPAPAKAMSVADAKRAIEEAVVAMGGKVKMLPWSAAT